MQRHYSLKPIAMSAIEMRSDILKWVDQVDETFLSAVHAMMGTYVEKQEQEDPIIGYDADFKPIKASVAKAQFAEELEAVERGEYLTIE